LAYAAFVLLGQRNSMGSSDRASNVIGPMIELRIGVISDQSDSGVTTAMQPTAIGLHGSFNNGSAFGWLL
jgi:hypothetical protein